MERVRKRLEGDRTFSLRVKKIEESIQTGQERT